MLRPVPDINLLLQFLNCSQNSDNFLRKRETDLVSRLLDSDIQVVPASEKYIYNLELFHIHIIGLISQVFLFKFLRNADRAVGELAGGEQGIAGGGEIEDQALLVLGAVLHDGGIGTGSDACHGDGNQRRSHVEFDE